ncbi:uncharacterized protein OCT59_014214 [Rhizophagus irregularis]|uniref:Uncharacterized protein n=4 Tax=Rhizophagus irregularis TaxID=588596 RepID=A0A915ZYN0_9GLOM|nr:hypothetical protein OCT59_014214 [Rhizophagus irregularis]GBC13902.2 hypothetical protein GLOIN_2v1773228 [Rhizophagus irregularis DAOM 181602=DAOM 197198]CAB5197340.1 unnamed protein product [Rhizophagus irregularis]CAB5395628.1 unnamed protein product [Rhizophagus irregularis]
MFFNKYYYYILYFVFTILQNRIVSSFSISYNELKENQIIDLIYFPCIKLNRDSHASNTNQFFFKKNQANICDESLLKYLRFNLNNNNCQGIKVNLSKNKILIEKEKHDVIMHNIDDSSSSSSSSITITSSSTTISTTSYSFKVDKKISMHACKAFNTMCDEILTTKCSKNMIKINECSQLSTNQFTSKCYCKNNNYNDNQEIISFSKIISNMLQSNNIKIISDNCRFNCYDYRKVCNEKCKKPLIGGNSKKIIEDNGKSIINFCNYNYQDDIYKISCICDSGIQRTNRILDFFRYRCEFD